VHLQNLNSCIRGGLPRRLHRLLDSLRAAGPVIFKLICLASLLAASTSSLISGDDEFPGARGHRRDRISTWPGFSRTAQKKALTGPKKHEHRMSLCPLRAFGGYYLRQAAPPFSFTRNTSFDNTALIGLPEKR